IWEQTRGKVTVFVSGVGTGGTISGVGRYLKERNPAVKVVGADPEGSVLSGGSPKPWKVEGIGEDFVPKTFTSQYVDEWERVGDLLRRRGEGKLVTVGKDTTAERAIRLMEETGISQLPVIDGGRPVGSVQEVTLARVLHDGRDPTQVTVGEVMARPLPVMDVHTHLDEAYRLLLAGYTGVLATQDGKVTDIVTRIDLIHYWDKNRAS